MIITLFFCFFFWYLTHQPKGSLDNKTLKDVDSTLMEAGSFLDDIAKTPKKQDCLKNFCACQDLIQWLKATAPKGLKLVCVLHNYIYKFCVLDETRGCSTIL